MNRKKEQINSHDIRHKCSGGDREWSRGVRGAADREGGGKWGGPAALQTLPVYPVFENESQKGPTKNWSGKKRIRKTTWLI